MLWLHNHAPEHQAMLADSLGAVNAPVQAAFAQVYHERPALKPRMCDGNEGHAPGACHPGAPGAYLQALVLYRAITGRSPVGLPAPVIMPRSSTDPILLTPDENEILQRAAKDAFGSGKLPVNP